MTLADFVQGIIAGVLILAVVIFSSVVAADLFKNKNNGDGFAY